MPRDKLRTLLILLAIGPPMLAWIVWPQLRERYAAMTFQSRFERLHTEYRQTLIEYEQALVRHEESLTNYDRIANELIQLQELQSALESNKRKPSATLSFPPDVERAMLIEGMRRQHSLRE